MAEINYVELPSGDIGRAKTFYTAAFGMKITDFGPTYAATMDGTVHLGLQADADEMTRAPLAVIAVDNLESALQNVVKAGGEITRPIFAFPGGRRFQFRDPNGNELAAVVSDDDASDGDDA